MKRPVKSGYMIVNKARHDQGDGESKLLRLTKRADTEVPRFSQTNFPRLISRVVAIGEKMFAFFYECSSNSR